MENRLRLCIESKRGLRGTRRLVAELNATEIQGLHHEIVAINEILSNVHQLCLMFLISSQCQRRDGILVNLIHMLPHPEEILHRQDAILRDKLQERDKLATTRHAQLRHDRDTLLALLGELRVHLEGTDTINLIAEEVNAIRVLRCIREYIDDATTKAY